MVTPKAAAASAARIVPATMGLVGMLDASLPEHPRPHIPAVPPTRARLIVYLQIVNRPVWWIVLLFIPIVNIVIAIILTNDLAKAFNKGIGWTIGMLLLGVVFYPMLAFGSDPFVGRQTA